MDEFKYTFTTEIQNAIVQKGDSGGFSGATMTGTGGAILFTNPQEGVSVGVRHIPMTVPVVGAAAFYMKELIKYPPQFKIGFLSNNPPAYDLAPKLKELMEKHGKMMLFHHLEAGGRKSHFWIAAAGQCPKNYILN